mmetsp:Transcript_11407/g.25436  ORF Transcript_11407/g.25436 Transcript_11407/m.25436 type:complete len:157 (-) Transcript_11407:40-510(-)
MGCTQPSGQTLVTVRSNAQTLANAACHSKPSPHARPNSRRSASSQSNSFTATGSWNQGVCCKLKDIDSTTSSPGCDSAEDPHDGPLPPASERAQAPMDGLLAKMNSINQNPGLFAADIMLRRAQAFPVEASASRSQSRDLLESGRKASPWTSFKSL